MAHILVERVSGAVEAENQCAVPGPGAIRVGDLFARVLIGRRASEANFSVWIETASFDREGGHIEWRDNGHDSWERLRRREIGGGL